MKYYTILLVVLWLVNTSCNKAEEKKPRKAAEPLTSYVRASSVQGNSAAYFQYVNPLSKDDTLLAVQADFAEAAQVHRSIKTKDGLMGMEEVKQKVIQGGDTLKFEQGGLHVMLIGLKRTISQRDTVNLTLYFAQAGKVEKALSVYR